jgi:hypothetical protein
LYRVLHRGRLKGLSVLLGNSHGAFLGEAMTNIIALPDNMIRKGQVEGIGKGDIRGQVRFVADLFKVAA